MFLRLAPIFLLHHPGRHAEAEDADPAFGEIEDKRIENEPTILAVTATRPAHATTPMPRKYSSCEIHIRCTAEVRDEILALLAGIPPHDIYLVPRRSYMMGRWIRGSGWYPNFRQPQFFHW